MDANSDASSATLTEIATTHSRSVPKRPPYFKLVFSHALITQAVLEYDYNGAGTEEDPYVVEFIPNDPRDPMEFPAWMKWAITILVAVTTLAVAFASSAYTGGVQQMMVGLDSSEEVVILGVSLFVLGFAIGPVVWAPMSETIGRQIIFIISYGAMTAFNAGAAGSQNIQTLLIMRFFAGAFGSSPLTNSGGVIADMFPASQRGVALSVFAAAPFMGPALGPIVGSFVGETVGWRWVLGVIAIFTGVLWILGSFTMPETYAPVLLRKRAELLSKQTGKVYKSRIEISQGKKSLAEKLKIALSRPWILLFREPIVFLFSIYIALVYGTLYMLFSAFPIVFQVNRGWSGGIGSLPFLGVAVGMLFAVGYSFWDNTRYNRINDKHVAKGERGAPPESRLPPAMIGSVFIPVGLFVFAWTNYPRIHWIVCVIFTAPFGFGMVLTFLSIFSYLIDSYTIYAASVMAANSILRSLLGAVFPLFTTYMYDGLGIHWASSVPAFLSLACVPLPFLFYKYGPAVRRKCKFSREAEETMNKLKRQSALPEGPEKELRRQETNQSNLRRQATNQTGTSRRDAEERMGLEDLEKGEIEAEDVGDKSKDSTTNDSNDIKRIPTEKEAFEGA